MAAGRSAQHSHARVVRAGVTRESVRGAGKDHSGATSVTMQIWYELDQAGQTGLTFDELLQKVSPRVPAGYAWRRYNRDYTRRSNLSGSSERLEDTTANRRRAVHFVVRHSVENMRRVGSVLKRADGHLATLRKPKAAFTDEQHDFDGSITHKEVAMMEFLRLWRPRAVQIVNEWMPHHPAGDMPTLRVAEFAVIQKLIEAHTKPASEIPPG